MSTLMQWFRRFATDPEVEIEARVKDVTDDEFVFVSQRLETNPSWSADVSTTMVDVTYAGFDRVRGTYDGQAAPGARAVSFIKKERIEFPLDISTGEPHHIWVRFALSREKRVSGPPRGVEGNHFRVKKRRSFVHNHQVAYELTRVQSGGSEEQALASRAQCEVELEWCGQATVPNNPNAETLSDLALGFVTKIDDVIDMIVQCRTRVGGGGGVGGGAAVAAGAGGI